MRGQIKKWWGKLTDDDLYQALSMDSLEINE